LRFFIKINHHIPAKYNIRLAGKRINFPQKGSGARNWQISQSIINLITAVCPLQRIYQNIY